MAVQSPPFALQNGSHSAALFRQAVYSMVSTSPAAGGVLNAADLVVAAQGTPNMSVQVSAGRAWIPGTQVANVSGGTWSTQAAYFGVNDAPVSVTIGTANATNPRIDVIYVSVNDQAYSGTLNSLVIGAIAGTPAASPVAPAAPSNSLVLAQVAVGANATSITSSNIAPNSALLTVAAGGITPVTISNTANGTQTGVYRDQPLGGLQRWDGGAWQSFGTGGDTGWVTLTPAAGWTPVTSSGDPGLRYRVRNGLVEVSFHITHAGSTWAGGATLFTLPGNILSSSTVYIRATKDATDGVNSAQVTISPTTGVATVNVGGSAGSDLYGSALFFVG